MSIEDAMARGSEIYSDALALLRKHGWKAERGPVAEEPGWAAPDHRGERKIVMAGDVQQQEGDAGDVHVSATGKNRGGHR